MDDTKEEANTKANTEDKSMMADLQYEVTQHEGTEQAFTNPYHDNKETGIYVDIVTGEPLFTSLDKYDSKTGWPSFTKPIVDDVITLHEDNSFFSLIYAKSEEDTETEGVVEFSVLELKDAYIF